MCGIVRAFIGNHLLTDANVLGRKDRAMGEEEKGRLGIWGRSVPVDNQCLRVAEKKGRKTEEGGKVDADQEGKGIWRQVQRMDACPINLQKYDADQEDEIRGTMALSASLMWKRKVKVLKKEEILYVREN